MEMATDFLTMSAAAPQVKLTVAAIGTAAALFLGHRPNVEAPNSLCLPKEIREVYYQGRKTAYFRIVASASGVSDGQSGPTEEDLISGARDAIMSR